MRTDYINRDCMGLLLTALMPQNRLALEVSMATGLRIDDVLALKSAHLSQRMTIREQKTGKNRRVYFPLSLYHQMLSFAGRFFVFEGRNDSRKHRTRQAVFKDLKRVSRLYRLDGRRLAENIAPHTARKIYAVEQYRKGKSLQKVQRLLNHSSEAVTLLYAMADDLTAARLKARKTELVKK